MIRKLAAAAVAGAVVLAHAVPADAAKAKKRVKTGYVSTYGYSLPVRVSGPVRYGRSGKEVRLPGGTWVNCFGGCQEALRRNTIDFWEWQASRERRAW